MTRLITASTALLAIHAISPVCLRAQQENSKTAYNWTGDVRPGRWIKLVNLNGTITFGTAPGSRVEIVATERWRRGDPSVVRFDVQQSGANGGDVTVCALWGTRARCDAAGSDEHDDNPNRNNDVSVDFRVLVPRGVKVAARSVNGTIVVAGVTADIDASTVNGEIELTAAGGPIRASTVNGEVKAHVTRGEADRMDFSAVNGSVVVDLPSDFGADIDLTTVTGELKSDFEMTVSGRIGGRHVAAHIGKPGGPRITLQTVNGDVQLHRG